MLMGMARSLMIIGTASHVGKSVMVTALCRVLRDRGVRVAPFKSQNIALNSFVCGNGAEIGRAQVVQAEAARLEPEPEMNPILLKPSAGGKVQVVLNGSVYGTMTGDEYSAQRSFFFEQALEAYQRLASRFDAIILEGAGSAAEVNLRDRDIVNLEFARAVGAPAVLVADIDRGGVFASIVGTFDLLQPAEAEIVRGFIINRFRGDPALFDDGVDFLERRTGRPCLGVLPYLDALGIDQEDGVSLEERSDTPAEFRVGCDPSATHFQLHRFQPPGTFRGAWGRISQDPHRTLSTPVDYSRQQEYDSRPGMDPQNRVRAIHPRCARFGLGRAWNLWGVPDAWDSDFRSRRG